MTQPRKTGEIRIIAGLWRGRKIPVLAEPGLRPTGDRIRETLFNWLQTKVVGSRCLDLFAGSGALGLEALSRGAAHVTFIDNNPAVIASLNKVLAQFQAQHKALVLTQAVHPALMPPAEPYDLVFLDPPFHQDYLAEICLLLTQNGWLKPQALIYLETEADLSKISLPTSWNIIKEKFTGNISYRLIEHEVR